MVSYLQFFQLGYCYSFDIKEGIPLDLKCLGSYYSIYLSGVAFRYSPLALCGFARVITGASCTSALVLGLGVLKCTL